MIMRKAEIIRKTAETDIVLTLDLDGKGVSEISTGCGFLDHMLTLLSSHSRFDMKVKCVGDTAVDFHHTVEDIGICLGKAINKALGDKAGITRYGNAIIPMDESLVLCAVDISGRSFLNFFLPVPTQKIGNFDSELTQEFFYAVVRESNIALHIKKIDGLNSHHIVEACFKAFARAMRTACAIDCELKGEIPSTKGVLV